MGWMREFVDTVAERWREDPRRVTKRAISTLLLLIGLAVAFLSFIQANATRIGSQNAEYLEELTAQRAISIDSLIAENESFIASTAFLYGESLSAPVADVATIRAFEENTVFDMLRFIDASGDNYTSQGLAANLADRPYFQAGMRGESGIAYVAQSRVTGQRQIGFYAPVRYEGQIIGVMVGFYGEDYVEQLLNYDLFGHEGAGWLCDAEGTVLGSTVDTDAVNYLDYLGSTGRASVGTVEQVRAAFAAGERVAYSYEEGSSEALAYAVPLTDVDWMLVRTFPASAANRMVSNANREGIVLLLEIIAIFAAYVLYFAVDFILEQRRVREANRNAQDISTGMQALFNAFVMLDLDSSTYAYVGGEPTYPGIAPAGSYDAIASAILACIPSGEEEHRAAIERAFAAESLRAALMDTDRISLRVHAPSSEGTWFTFNFMVIERREGVPSRLLVTLQDVTDLYLREQEEQRRLQEALDIAESASHAKTEFLFNMSHDLRTPMNAIIGYTELARHEGVTLDEMRSFIEKIDASSEHLLALINDILEMSRIESGKMTLVPELCDLPELIDDARSLFSNQMCAKGIHLYVDSCSSVEDRWVLCDRNRLNRIILNLVSNAYKFTPEGGTVEVELCETERLGDEARYELRVADTGIGMSPEFVERLFMPFERERSSTVSGTQGTGLGLSITKKIVDLMGGTIEVETEQGKGTTFTVTLKLPIAEGPEEEKPSSEHMPQGASFEGVRTLLVEDQPINREIASMLLTHHGFVVETAGNGQEAVERVASAEPGAFDVILMDIQMPVMNGYEATLAIRALDDDLRASTPIVAMTANAFQEDVQAALDAGMDGHIAKPIDVDTMLATLARVLGR